MTHLAAHMKDRFQARLFTILGFAVFSIGHTLAGEVPGSSTVILDMDTVRHQPTEATTKDKQKVPIGSVELVDGKFGKAVQFNFAGGVGSGFMTTSVKGTPEWDQAEGFSFYVKGDGSTNWAGLELIDRENFKLRYGFCFPIASRDWQKITVAWRDVIPELAGPLVGFGGYAPSGFGNFWFGKWFYWRDYPAHSFAIDQVTLEKKISPETTATSADDINLQRFRKKLAEKKPITIVTMGDSLSDKRHWANQKILWSELLVKQLETKYGSTVKLINPAIGGTTLSQNLILMPRWVRENPNPDLVTVCFGFNDWDNGVRGERFKDYLRLAVERLRRQTQGPADILLITTCPAHGRWETMKEMEQAAREVAAKTKVGIVDIATEFRRAGNPDQALKAEYWAWDKTHLGAKGHALVAETVLRAIEGGSETSK